MPLKFLPPEQDARYKTGGTTFMFDRIPSAELETIRRNCYEEGKGGGRFMLNQNLHQDKLLQRALKGWENFELTSGVPFEFNEDNKKKFIEFGDLTVKSELASFVENPSMFTAIFLDAEKKDSGSGGK